MMFTGWHVETKKKNFETKKELFKTKNNINTFLKSFYYSN